jgi:Family of unknown function (DUF6494)
MNEDTFNMSVRRFLKSFGLNGQREIEHAVANAIASGAIAGTETFPAKITLQIAGLKLSTDFAGEISLQ